MIHPGDAIAWCFYSEDATKTGNIQRQSKGMPRRIGIRASGFHDEGVFGRALTFAVSCRSTMEPALAPAFPCSC